MWANTVWGLWGLTASCLLTVTGLSPESAWQGTLLVGAAVFFFLSLLVLAWPLRDKDCRGRIKENCKHPLTLLANAVDPTHIIIFGLVIALGGAIWLNRKQPAEPKNPSVASAQTKTPAPTSSPAFDPVASARKMSEYDRVKLQKVIDEVLPIYETGYGELIRRAVQLLDYLPLIAGHAAELETESKKLVDNFKNKDAEVDVYRDAHHRNHPDFVELLIRPDDGQLVGHVALYSLAVTNMDKQNPNPPPINKLDQQPLRMVLEPHAQQVKKYAEAARVRKINALESLSAYRRALDK